MGLIAVAAHPAFATVPGVLEMSIEEARTGLAFLRKHGLAGG
jgi:hypothetical protein